MTGVGFPTEVEYREEKKFRGFVRFCPVTVTANVDVHVKLAAGPTGATRLLLAAVEETTHGGSAENRECV